MTDITVGEASPDASPIQEIVVQRSRQIRIQPLWGEPRTDYGANINFVPNSRQLSQIPDMSAADPQTGLRQMAPPQIQEGFNGNATPEDIIKMSPAEINTYFDSFIENFRYLLEGHVYREITSRITSSDASKLHLASIIRFCMSILQYIPHLKMRNPDNSQCEELLLKVITVCNVWKNNYTSTGRLSSLLSTEAYANSTGVGSFRQGQMDALSAVNSAYNAIVYDPDTLEVLPAKYRAITFQKNQARMRVLLQEMQGELFGEAAKEMPIPMFADALTITKGYYFLGVGSTSSERYAQISLMQHMFLVNMASLRPETSACEHASFFYMQGYPYEALKGFNGESRSMLSDVGFAFLKTAMKYGGVWWLFVPKLITSAVLYQRPAMEINDAIMRVVEMQKSYKPFFKNDSQSLNMIVEFFRSTSDQSGDTDESSLIDGFVEEEFEDFVGEEPAEELMMTPPESVDEGEPAAAPQEIELLDSV